MTKILDEALLSGFLEAARSGSIGIAAKNLGRSQPLLTNHIRRLEDIVGCQLFLRTSRGVSLTPEGKEFLPYAKRIVAVSEDAMKRFAKNNPERRGQTRIKLSEDLVGEAVLKSLVAMTPLPGRLDLEIVPAGEAPSATAFEQGDVDIFFGDPSPVLSAALKPAKVVTTRLVWAASPNFDPTRRPLPLALYPGACAWRAPIAEALDRELIEWFMAVESGGLSALQLAARSEIAMIACLLPSLGEGLVALDYKVYGLPEPPGVEIALYRSLSRRPPPDLEALEKFLWQLISNPTP
jgi:DNA-binding transcriptional LysR family regulator